MLATYVSDVLASKNGNGPEGPQTLLHTIPRVRLSSQGAADLLVEELVASTPLLHEKGGC